MAVMFRSKACAEYDWRIEISVDVGLRLEETPQTSPVNMHLNPLAL